MKRHFLPTDQSELKSWEETFLIGFRPVLLSLGFTSNKCDDIETALNNNIDDYNDKEKAVTAANTAIAKNDATRIITEKIIRAMAQKAKKATGYNPSTGAKLTIIGENKGFDSKTAQPSIKGKIKSHYVSLNGSFPREVDTMYIKSARGNETELSHIVTITGGRFIDTRPNLTELPEVHTYTFLYMIKNKIIGKESQQFSIIVPYYLAPVLGE